MKCLLEETNGTMGLVDRTSETNQNGAVRFRSDICFKSNMNMSDISISSGFLVCCVRYCGGRTLAQPTPPLNGTRTSLQPNLPATYFKIGRKSLSKQGGKHISQPGL